MAAGELTAEALVRSCLDRIAACEPDIMAFAALDAEGALAAATAIDREGRKGPLAGLPVAIKDNIETRDLPTGFGSPRHHGTRTGRDAAIVTLLRRAGAIILGKAHTVEFAGAGRIPPTRNPHDLAHTPGGSSSGSGAAVAAGMVPLAIGTQTGGSVIRPASFTGTAAMKPSYGLIGMAGVHPFAPSLDTIGWFARSVADLHLVATALGVAGEPACEVGPHRIGLCRGPHWEEAEPAMRSAVLGAADILREGGHSVGEIALPPALDGLTLLQETIMYGEGHVSLAPEAVHGADALDPGLRRIVFNERSIAPGDVRTALAAVCRAGEAFDALFGEGLTALLTPAAAGEAPAGFAGTGSSAFNKMWSAFRAPCIALPAGVGPRGLPVGVQLVGRRGGDRDLLDLARTLEPLLQGRG